MLVVPYQTNPNNKKNIFQLFYETHTPQSTPYN